MLEHRAVQLLADEPESIVDVRVPVRIEGGDPHEPRVVVEEHEPQFVNPDLCELLGTIRSGFDTNSWHASRISFSWPGLTWKKVVSSLTLPSFQP